MSKDQLDEFKADGEDSSTMDPTNVSAKKRKADQTGTKDSAEKLSPEGKQNHDGAKAKTPARKADKTMKEYVNDIFEGEDLTEEFMDKASVVFESAVLDRVNTEVARLEEELSQSLDEQAEKMVTDLSEKVDSYLSYVIEGWLKENELAIESGIKADIAESFMDGLKTLFAEHSLELPDEQVDLVAEMAESIEELEQKLNEQINIGIELRKELDEAKEEDIFAEVSEGLVETQIEKFKSLTEGLEYTNVDEYKRKIGIIKENYFNGKTVLTEEADELDEVVIGDNTNNKFVDPEIASFAKAISKNVRNSR